MDLSWQEFNANMRGSWNPEEPDRRAFHSHPRDYEPSFQESDGGPRTRDAMNGRGLLPIPNSFPTNRSYPPGFDNSRMSPPGLDNGYRNAPGFDSNRRRRSGFDDNHRSRSGFENGHDFHVQEDSEGGPSELLANEKTKKRKKLGAEDAPPTQRSSTATNNYERATKVCHKLWKDLDCAIQQRERNLREEEESFTPSTINKEVLEEDMKQTAAMKNEIMEERRRLEEEAQRIRKEKDAMERTSTELAVQVVELKQVRRQLEKEKAALLAQKAELFAKERCSQERDCVNATVDTPLVAVKAEIEEPIIDFRRDCGKSTNYTSEYTSISGATPSNIENQEPKTAMDVPLVASNRNLRPVKAEPVTSER